MFSTSRVFWFLMISSYPLTISCGDGKEVLTFEQFEIREGENFCSWTDMFRVICTKVANLNDIQYDSITKTSSCTQKNISLFSKNENKPKTTTEDLLRCAYNRIIIMNVDQKIFEHHREIESRLLGRGPKQTDMMEYIEAEDGVVPRSNYPGALDDIVIILVTKDILTSEQYKTIRGESFCSLEKSADEFNMLCAKIAQLNNIEYHTIKENTSCDHTKISLFSENRAKLETTTENLLRCGYDSVATENVNGETVEFVRFLGRGKDQSDVMEYRNLNGVIFPIVNRLGLLDEIGMKLHRENILTFEEYRSLERQELCYWKSMYKIFCTRIAELNGIKGYSIATITTFCSSQNISLYSVKEGIMKTVEGGLLRCDYYRVSKDKREDEKTPFESRILGIGKKQEDVMEYQQNADVVVPFINRTDLLKEIKDILRTKSILTLEQYKSFKGEKFCSTRSSYDFIRLCVQVAQLNGIRDYFSITGNTSCYENDIQLVSEINSDLEKVPENLLHCEYNNRRIEWNHDTNYEAIIQFEFRALGIGKEANDVVEYTVRKGVATPFAYRADLLDRIDKIITLEEHGSLQGKDFCSKKVEKIFYNLCERVAQLNNIRGDSLTMGNQSCNETKINLYSTAKSGLQQTEEDLLLCNYTGITYKVENDELIKVPASFGSRALGRGIKETDVMEYEIIGSVAKPLANRENMLLEI